MFEADDVDFLFKDQGLEHRFVPNYDEINGQGGAGKSSNRSFESQGIQPARPSEGSSCSNLSDSLEASPLSISSAGSRADGNHEFFGDRA